MSKYIQRARHFARETSHQFHNVRDDVLKRQIQKERSKLPRNSEFSSISSTGSNAGSGGFKFSDIDMMEESESMEELIDEEVTADEINNVNCHNHHQIHHTTPNNTKLFDDGPDLFEDVHNDSDFPPPIPPNEGFQDPLGLNPHRGESPLFDELDQHDDDIVVSDSLGVATEELTSEITNDLTLTKVDATAVEDEEYKEMDQESTHLVQDDTNNSLFEANDDELFHSLSTSLTNKSSQNNKLYTSSNDENDDDLFQSIKPETLTEEHMTPTTEDTPGTFPTNNSKTVMSNPMISEVESHPLLLQDLDDDYMYNYYSDDLSIGQPIVNNTHPPKNELPINSSPEDHSPLSSSPQVSSFRPKKTKMVVSKVGKLVPVIPPRPNSASKSSVNGDDSSAMSDPVLPAKKEFVEKPKRLELSDTGTPSVAAREDSKQQATVPVGEDDYTLLMSLSFAVLLLYLYYSLNPFVYLAGFLAGFTLFYVTVGSAFVLYVQYSEREKEKRKENEKKVNLPSMSELPATIKVNFEDSRILESHKFGMVHQYHPTTHHPNQRIPAKVKLYKDFFLEVQYRQMMTTPQGGTVTKKIVLNKDLRSCSILIVPEEVAQNRKRRWSKKFPLSISWADESKGRVYLFPFASRDKEEWFRRLRAASEGQSYDQLTKASETYYRYMGLYMPSSSAEAGPWSATKASSAPAPPTSQPSSRHHHRKGGAHQTTSVHFSAADLLAAAPELEDTSVSIEKQKKPSEPPHPSRNHHASKTAPGGTPNGKTTPPSDPATPMSLSFSLGWINAGMARLAWDLWHEERWNKWVTSRIQRKLVRIKTPSFMETLKVTDVNMGMNMPVIKSPFKLPKVDNRGLWIYLSVEYEGSFTMTIETKLKLEPKGVGEVLHFNATNSSPPLSHSTTSFEHGGGQSKSNHRHHRTRKFNHSNEEEEEISSGSDEENNDSNSLTQSLEEKLPTELENNNSSFVTSPPPSDNTQNSITGQSNSQGPPGRKEKLLNNMVSRLQKIATKSRLVAKAAEKVSSYPLTLSVEVKRLNGLLVLNMAPPPSDAIWYGFAESPYLELVAKPKLGQREVTLSYVTDWIEKKLCEVVEKKLVLPNMEDLVVPLLNSGLPEDKVKETLMSP